MKRLSIFALLSIIWITALTLALPTVGFGQDYVATSTTRPTIASMPRLLVGNSLFETNTGLWRIWTGVAWAQANMIVPPGPFYVATYANRPTLANTPRLVKGSKFFASDTGLFYIWGGSTWVLLNYSAPTSGSGSGDVKGPASATAGNVPTLDATGKVLADSGKTAASMVTGPASATVGAVPTLDATGKVLSAGPMNCTGSTCTIGTIVLDGTSVSTGAGGATSGYGTFYGVLSGSALIGVADTAGSPNRINLPIATGAAGGLLMTNGANPQQLSWSAGLSGLATQYYIPRVSSTPGVLEHSQMICNITGCGIGVSPSYAFHNYAATGSIYSVTETAAANTVGWRAKNTQGQWFWGLGYSVGAPAGGYELYDITRNYSRMVVDTVGAVGLSQPSPVGLLDIPGPFNFSATPTPVRSPTAGAPTAGGGCTAGTHSFKVTFLNAAGETLPSSASSQITCVDTSGQTVPLSGIVLGPPGTTGRNIYATKTGDSGSYYLVATSPVISNNTAVTYSFTIADGSFTVTTAPVANSTALGVLQVSGSPKLVLGGPVPGITGCGAATGSNTAGIITSDATGTCTPVLTFVVAAATGWTCFINNQTHPGATNMMGQTATTTQSATFSGTTVSGDVLNYFCRGY